MVLAAAAALGLQVGTRIAMLEMVPALVAAAGSEHLQQQVGLLWLLMPPMQHALGILCVRVCMRACHVFHMRPCLPHPP